ncbi:MAG: DUF6265 family protein [Pedobacter sp.]|jgi:hypothetical protein|uniref:DUF6265 family protein n=1 Tax=Pedobacter sp. TaxID=1411316 RepID=UPI00356A0099
MKKYLVFLAIGLSFQISAVAQNKSIKQFSFMLGTWDKKTEKGKLSETWVRTKDGLLGKSYKHSLKGDSILMETVVIKKIDNDFYFCVTGAQEDKTKMVKFKLISFEDKLLMFENKTHDFPQRIVYENKGRDNLFAWIWGVSNGKEGKLEFNYKRRK